MAEEAPKTESKVEGVKKSSRHLRGKIAETMASGATHFSEEDATLLKFHGVYHRRSYIRHGAAMRSSKTPMFMARVPSRPEF
jgi:sulfite reductase beta subunit-like hemoprotein